MRDVDVATTHHFCRYFLTSTCYNVLSIPVASLNFARGQRVHGPKRNERTPEVVDKTSKIEDNSVVLTMMQNHQQKTGDTIVHLAS